MMRMTRLVALGWAALALTATAFTQINGPTPLAWRWSSSTNVMPSGSPTLDGDNVFVGVGGRVFCVDRLTGNKKWQYPLIEPIDGSFVGSPVRYGNLLIAAGSNKTIYALDPEKGEKVWTYDAPGGVVGSPIIVGKFLVFNVDGTRLMAIDAETGGTAWENPEKIFDGLQGGLVGTGSDVFFFTRTREMWSMKVTTRKATRLAKFQNLSPNATPNMVGETLYIASGNYVIAMNPASGAARWQTALPYSLVFAPAASRAGVVVGTADNKLVLLDPNGQLRQQRVKGADGRERTVPIAIDLGSRPISSPSIVGDLAAVPTANGAVNLVDLAKGELVWSFTIRPLVAGLKDSAGKDVVYVTAVGSPVASGNTMLVLAADGSMLAFDKEQGVDLTGPSVQLVFPTQGAQVGNRKGLLEAYFLLADEASGINDKTLTVTANGRKLDYLFGRDGYLILQFGQGTKNGVLGDGRVVIEITASDWMGNQTKASFNFMIDNDLAPLPKPGNVPAAGGRTGGGGGGSGGSAG